MVYHTCPLCGANLDPGERCDCESWMRVELPQPADGQPIPPPSERRIRLPKPTPTDQREGDAPYGENLPS